MHAVSVSVAANAKDLQDLLSFESVADVSEHGSSKAPRPSTVILVDDADASGSDGSPAPASISQPLQYPRMLMDTEINWCMQEIRKMFPDVRGFQDTVTGASKWGYTYVRDGFQIMHSPPSHWV